MAQESFPILDDLILIDGEPLPITGREFFDKYKPKFETALAQHDGEIYDSFELQYRGTQTTTKNINSKSNVVTKKTNVVWNILFELVESQVNTDIPEPQVQSCVPGFKDQAEMIEEKIRSDIKKLNLDKVADQGDRDTYKHGMSLIMLDWNIKGGSHSEIGEKEIINKHPKQIIPQSGVYETDEMDCLFSCGVATKGAMFTKYGVDVSHETLAYPELNEIAGITVNDSSDDSASGNYNSENELVDEIICLYKDKDGDFCKAVWIGATLVDFQPKYFFPRTMFCKKCNTDSPADATVCEECSSSNLNINIHTFEIIERNVMLTPLSYYDKTKRAVEDGKGGFKTEVTETEVVIPRMVPKGTRVDYFSPKTYPLVKRINIPKAFSFRGISDIEIITTLQESLKKVLSRIEEKILLAPAIVGVPRGLNKTISNRVYDVIEASAAELSQIIKFDLQVDIQQDVLYANMLYEMAKSTLGVTDSFQGKYDPSARTGEAKKVQVQQSAGRLSSKYKNKYIAFGELFQKMFFFDLIYSSSPRSFAIEAVDGRISYKKFNKYELLMQDASGEWYYNTDFIFRARKASEIPADDVSIMKNALEMRQMEAVTNEQLWQILDTVNYPIANKILEQMRGQTDQQTGQMLATLQAMQPAARFEMFKKPIDEMMELLNQTMQQQQSRQG